MRAAPEAVWRRAAGAGVFGVGLCVWATVSLRSLPYAYHDLHYLLSLEGGYGPEPVEWVHPLFIPALSWLQHAAIAAGAGPHALLPLEWSGVAAGGATLCALFWACARRGGDSLVAAGIVLWLAFTYGFWAGAMRPDPYAWAAAATAACLIILSGGEGPLGRERALSAGLFAGVACGLHLSALALAPAGAAGILVRAGGGSSRRALVQFLGAQGCVLAACYALLLAHHGAGVEFLLRQEFSSLFPAIEQIPGSSLYTAEGPAAQARALAATFARHGGRLLPILTLAGAAVVALSRETRATALAPAVSALAFAGFFFINNSQNGFAYAALLSAPLLVAALAPAWRASRGWHGPVFLAAAILSAPSSPLGDGVDSDPILEESRFLTRLLAPRDLVVMPGCPFPELMYERRFDALQTGPYSLPFDRCVAPRADGEELEAWLTHALAGGRVVYAALGGAEKTFSRFGDRTGERKRVGPFLARHERVEGEPRKALLVALGKDFFLDEAVFSPQGWEYRRLRARRPARARAALAGSRASVRDGRDSRRAREYLLAWTRWSPDDAYAARALASLPKPEVEAPRAARARALLEEGLTAHRAGRAEEAERAFAAALQEAPDEVSAWLSLGAVRAAAGRHEQALPCYDRALALLPSHGDVRADALAARANSAAALRRSGRARADRRAALVSATAGWRWRGELERALRDEVARP